MLKTILLSLAGIIASAWCLFHIVQGGKEVVRPLRSAPGLDPVVRNTLYLCWHFVTVTLALMATFFLLAATQRKDGLALAATALAAGFTLLGIVQVPAIGARYGDLPQGWLFLPIALLGGAALVV